MNLRSHCAVIALGLVLGSCTILPKSEAPDIYLLPASPVQAAPPSSPVQAALRIVTPQAPRMLDSLRIAVIPQGNVITTYQGARWSDRAPRLVRDRLLDAFRSAGRFAALSSDDAHLRTDLELTGDLRAFQSEYGQDGPVVVIRYDAQLVQARSQDILAARRFDIRQPVAGKELPQVVTAFGQATDQLAAQVVAWTSIHAATTAAD